MPSANGHDAHPSEFELIELFSARPPDPARVRIGVGDDAAVVDSAGRVVTSVDTVVEGIHFRRDWSSPEQIGMKAVGAALSDLAAMGAGESGADVYLSLGAPRDTDPALLRGVARGAVGTAGRHGATLLGGDTVSSPVLFIGVTVIAHAAGDDPLVSRAGARIGDLVAVTGELGGACAGLWLLENPALPVIPELRAEVRSALITRQLEAEPRIAAGAALARSGATAMIDVSDGLVADLGHIVRASTGAGAHLSARVEGDLVPLAAGAGEVASATGVDPLVPALRGGEDYELAVTIPADRVGSAIAALAPGGLGLTVIGRVEGGSPGTDPVRVFRDGAPAGFDGPGGFDHFA